MTAVTIFNFKKIIIEQADKDLIYRSQLYEGFSKISV